MRRVTDAPGSDRWSAEEGQVGHRLMPSSKDDGQFLHVGKVAIARVVTD